MPPSSTAELGRAAINGADELSVQLIQPDDMPAVVRIVWPLQSTMVNPKYFPEVAAVLTRLFAEAATTLAQIKARRRL